MKLKYGEPPEKIRPEKKGELRQKRMLHHARAKRPMKR